MLERMKQYARLLVRVGVNIQKGQNLVLLCPVAVSYTHLDVYKRQALLRAIVRIQCRSLRMVPETGVEPARSLGPRDFKSRASANSATPAFVCL